MVNVERVKQQAIDVKRILDDFFENFNGAEDEFRSSFHLRPTSSGDTTILSTLPIAPMRGISVKNDRLLAKLCNVQKVLEETNDNTKLEMLKAIGFLERGSVSQREEDAQAALIRDLVLNPQNYNDMLFVASEFDLFNYGEDASDTKRADVLTYKDGILYNIELKNERLTETVRQAAGYVEHMKKHLNEYSACLYEFPNCKIGTISDIKGIALVPYSERSGGNLEKASTELSIEMWYFDKEMRIIKP